MGTTTTELKTGGRGKHPRAVRSEYLRGRRSLCDSTRVNLSQTLQDQRAAMFAAAPRHCAHNLRVFGSVAPGIAKPASDIDLLVDTLPGATLFDLGALQVELEELPDARVDLLTPGDLPISFRDTVLYEAVAL